MLSKPYLSETTARGYRKETRSQYNHLCEIAQPVAARQMRNSTMRMVPFLLVSICLSGARVGRPNPRSGPATGRRVPPGERVDREMA